MKKRGALLFFILVMALGAPIGACSSSKSTPVPTSSGPAAAEVVFRTNDAMAAVNALHFELTHNKGGTAISLDIQMEKLVADVQRPDRMSGSISGTFGKAYFKDMQLVIIGDTAYVNVIRWFVFQTDVSPLGFLNAIGAMLNNVTNLQSLSDKQDNGVLYYRVSGDVSAQDLRSFVGGDVTSNTAHIEIWVNSQSYLVGQVVIQGQLTTTDASGIIRTIKVSSYNEPLNIQAPTTG